MGKYGLSNMEFEIMEFLWQKNVPVPFKEILNYFNDEKGKNWKKQTLSTYLSNLRRSGFINADASGTYNLYYYNYSRSELTQIWTKKMVKESFGGSISSFVAAFTGGKKLSQEEAEKIDIVYCVYGRKSYWRLVLNREVNLQLNFKPL